MCLALVHISNHDIASLEKYLPTESKVREDINCVL